MEDSAENSLPTATLTRREFLKAVGVGTGAFFVSNSLLGEYLENLEPDIHKPDKALTEYKIAWDARPWVWINLAIAADRINGTVINPGEEVSVNNLLGFASMKDVSRTNTDPQKGYIAAQMSNPTKLDGWGYGLCLGSTALFRASLDSPLQITDRSTHYDIYSSYFKDMPVGTDASVFYPDPGDKIPETDLKFRNPTDKPLTIVLRIFDEFGKELKPPENEVSTATYKASFLDQITKILRRKVDQASGVEIPQQFLPEHTFGNSKIVVQVAICGEGVDYDVDLSPVKHGDSTVVEGVSQYAFTRRLSIKDSMGNQQKYQENFVSQYGSSPLNSG